MKALVRSGHEVVAWVRPTSNLQRLQGIAPVQFAKGDLCDRAGLERAMAGVDAAFHTAAYVELGIVDAAEMTRVNVEGTRSVLEAARAAGVAKVVYCSTVGIYGDTQGRVVDETYQREQEGFSSPYDRTKYEAQQVVDRYAASGLAVASVMPTGIMGSDDPHFRPIVRAFMRGKLPLWAGGDRVTGIVHVDDLAAAMIQAAQVGQPGEHYITSAGDMSTRSMFEILSKECGSPVPKEAPEGLVRFLGNVLDPIGQTLRWQPPLSRERVHYLYDRCVRVDASKARRELGWEPRSPETVLRELVAALREEETQRSN